MASNWAAAAARMALGARTRNRWAELEKRILRLHKDGMGLLKIGRTLGVGTALVQGVVGPFDAAA
jgi:hypothetical protein